MGTPVKSLTVGDPWSPQFHRTAASASSSSSSDQWSYKVMYESSSCDDDMPIAIFVNPDCHNESELYDCSPIDWTDTPYDPNNISADPLAYSLELCVAETDVDERVDSTYGDQAYLRYDYYVEEDCRTLDAIGTYVVDGNCYTAYAINDSTEEIFTESWRVFVNDNGSITFQVFYNGDCSGDVDDNDLYEREVLESRKCFNGTVFSTTAKAGTQMHKPKALAIVYLMLEPSLALSWPALWSSDLSQSIS